MNTLPYGHSLSLSSSHCQDTDCPQSSLSGAFLEDPTKKTCDELASKLALLEADLEPIQLFNSQRSITTQAPTPRDTLRRLTEKNNVSRVIEAVPELTEFEDQEEHQPMLKWCPACEKEVVTELAYRANSKTFYSALGILLAGGVFGCCMIPYMTDSCKALQHTCSSCKRPL